MRNVDDYAEFCLIPVVFEHLQQLQIIKNALEKSKDSVSELDQALWQQCNAKVHQLLLNDEKIEKEKTDITVQTTPPNSSDKNEKEPHSELIASASKPVKTAAEASEDQFTDLSSAMSLANKLITLYHYQPIAGTTCDNTEVFLIHTQKGKKLTIFEAMKPKNRNPIITRLLRYIHLCRTFNNLEQELNCYKILKNPKFKYMLQFERLLEEAVWTLLHCAEDPHSGGFASTQAERLEALILAKKLMFICLQHTVNQPGIIVEASPRNTVDGLCKWLDNSDNFDGDEELNQFTRHNIRCRAGSGLGHIFRFIQEETGRSALEETASLCFQAKTRFDPSYKPENKDPTGNRHRYYQRVTLER